MPGEHLVARAVDMIDFDGIHRSATRFAIAFLVEGLDSHVLITVGSAVRWQCRTVERDAGGANGRRHVHRAGVAAEVETRLSQ